MVRVKLALLFLPLLLASCGYVSAPALSPYKMDIRQGNYITQEMREKLKLGMSRAQVRYVLGTPLISDPFHSDRWDYIYSLEQRGEVVEKQRLTLYFEGDRLVRVDDGQQMVSVPALPVEDVATPLAAQPADADPSAAVLGSVQAWAKAWAAKDVRSYLAAYRPDFKPQEMSRDAWEKQRLDRISKPRAIEVELSDVSISMPDDSHASVLFMQHYRSDSYRDSVRKTLKMEKIDGVWLIASEQVEGK